MFKCDLIVLDHEFTSVFHGRLFPCFPNRVGSLKLCLWRTEAVPRQDRWEVAGTDGYRWPRSSKFSGSDLGWGHPCRGVYLWHLWPFSDHFQIAGNHTRPSNMNAKRSLGSRWFPIWKNTRWVVSCNCMWNTLWSVCMIENIEQKRKRGREREREIYIYI